MNPEKHRPQLKLMIRALKHRNFRLFFGGQSISLIGTWMQRVALGWMVYRLTNSAFLLGLIGFAGQIPTFILTPFAGVLADRWNRHRILIVTQCLAMAQAFILSILVMTDAIRIWHVVLLSLFLGIINSFDMPTRQSFMIEMVEDKDDLGNAIALNSSMMNGAQLLGPTIAGIVIAVIGEGMCFLINGISYVAVIASLLFMKMGNVNLKTRRLKVRQELKEGFGYIAGFEPIRDILLMLALMSLMGMPYTVLMPIFAKDVLHGGPHTLGFLMGSAGLGALAGALYLAQRKNVLGLGKMIPIAATIFSLGLMTFSFSRLMLLSMLLMLMVGFGQMVQMASSNTIVQTIVDDDKRGRVMSFYTLSFMGMAPIGSLIAGSLASRIGASWTLFAGGVACIVGAVIFLRRLPAIRKITRPLYVQMGILPEIASGINHATELSRNCQLK
jgi:MFS family permease